MSVVIFLILKMVVLFFDLVEYVQKLILLSDSQFDRDTFVSNEVSILSAPMLVCNWLSAIFYFEYPKDMNRFLDIIQKDSNMEIVSIKNEVKKRSLLRISLIISNLESMGKPCAAKMSSFFVELQLQFSWAWYLKHQTFRLGQIAKCEPEHLLQSQAILKKKSCVV